MGHHHEIAVRYGEVDLQRVVFNAHYLAYVDDAMDHWMRQVDADFESPGWDFMVKRAEIDWHGPAGLGDLIEIDSGIDPVGHGPRSWSPTTCTSGSGRSPPMLITYVGVEAGTLDAPRRRRPAVRAHLGEA